MQIRAPCLIKPSAMVEKQNLRFQGTNISKYVVKNCEPYVSCVLIFSYTASVFSAFALQVMMFVSDCSCLKKKQSREIE